MTDLWIEGDEGRSFVEQIESEIITRSYRWEGATTISGPSATVYRAGENITTTAMPSGSNTVSGDIITIKPLVALDDDAGQEYVVLILATVDGNYEARKQLVKIKSKKDAP